MKTATHHLKTGCLCVVFIVLVALSCEVQTVAAAAGKKPVLIALQMDTSSFAGQLRAIYEKAAKVYQEKYASPVEIVIVNEDAVLIEGVNKHKYDLFFSWNKDLMLEAIKKNGYSPFVSYEYFGIKNDERCIYAKEAAFQKLTALKGKKLFLNDNMIDYFILRKMIGGVKPDDYFGAVKASPKNLSFFYSLSLGEADAIVNPSVVYEIFKKNNPGPVSGVRKIVCYDKFPRLFLLRAPGAQAGEVASRISAMLVKISREKAFNDYKQLLKTTGIEFFPITISEYKPMFDLITEAKKKGWDKDYRKWIAAQNE